MFAFGTLLSCKTFQAFGYCLNEKFAILLWKHLLVQDIGNFHQGVNNILKKVKIKLSILNQMLVGTKSFLGNKILN